MQAHWKILALVGCVVMFGGTLASATVVNPVSQFPITVDGQFTGANEWSDVTPVAFISPPSSGPAIPTTLSDPLKNSLLYATIAPGATIADGAKDLYLLYDYLPRTITTFTSGEFVADIAFPVTAKGINGGPDQKINITVQIRGAEGGGVDISVDLGPDFGVEPAFLLDIDAAIGFGRSLLFQDVDHLLVELEVPLLIPPGFGSPDGPFPSGGLSGIYSPAPAFWSADVANDSGDPQAGAAIFTISPNGSLSIDPVPAIDPVPEPATLLSLASGLLGLAFYRWKRRQ